MNYCTFAFVITTGQTGTIRFANYYGSHMVLQRAPKSAIVWGYIPVCERVVVQFDEKSLGDAKLIPGTCKALYVAMYMPVDYI